MSDENATVLVIDDDTAILDHSDPCAGVLSDIEAFILRKGNRGRMVQQVRRHLLAVY
jgi:hypothetical protein